MKGGQATSLIRVTSGDLAAWQMLQYLLRRGRAEAWWQKWKAYCCWSPRRYKGLPTSWQLTNDRVHISRNVTLGEGDAHTDDNRSKTSCDTDTDVKTEAEVQQNDNRWFLRCTEPQSEINKGAAPERLTGVIHKGTVWIFLNQKLSLNHETVFKDSQQWS